MKEKTDFLRKDCFYEHPFEYDGKIPQSEGVRSNQWKYIRWVSQDPVYEELYDLENDPDEMKNLAANSTYQDRLETMRSRWAELKKMAAGTA